jgi:uncharacterized protein YaaQ
MKLLVAIIQNEDEDLLAEALEAEGIASTRIGSSGGFLRSSNVTLIMAVDDTTIDRVLELLSKYCKRRTKYLHTLLPGMEARERFMGAVPIEVGGATVFVLPLERIEKID